MTDNGAIRRAVAEKCTECGLCRQECLFIRKHGLPKTLAVSFDPDRRDHQVRAFECSLCGLCSAVCPAGVDPGGMMLEMRREAVVRGGGVFPEHAPLLAYERRGSSPRYSWYGLPPGCQTVLFPGCTLSGTRPGRVRELHAHLEKSISGLGIVLDCCGKPSRDLGREEYFQAMFREMTDYLLAAGVRQVLVACPNCHRVFQDCGLGLTVRSVYEALRELGPPERPAVTGVVTIHDPCPIRFEDAVQGAARRLVAGTGLTIEEMPHHGARTFCCGEGGTAGAIWPEAARTWTAHRRAEAGNRRMITYCAGCVNLLRNTQPTDHLLDLVFAPEKTLAGKVRGSHSPWTYWNRLRLKSYFRKTMETANSRERTFQPEGAAAGGGWKRILLLLLLFGTIAAVRVTGLNRYLEPNTLRSWIDAGGILAPVLYMLVYITW